MTLQMNTAKIACKAGREKDGERERVCLHVYFSVPVEEFMQKRTHERLADRVSERTGRKR